MISTLLTAVLSLSSLSSASTLRNKRDSGILRLPVTTTNVTDLLSFTSKRQTVAPLANVQTGTRYLVSFSIGTPSQDVSVALDTGSSETWVNPECSTSGPADSVNLCNSLPVYDSSKSSTAVDKLASNVLNYGKGSASIEYFSDNFLVGGATVTGQIFGVAASSSEIPTGLMGVGPGIELTGYPIIIDSLATQGITNSRAFSLDLRSVDSPDGAIIFGGIDTKKYKGALEKCPIIPAAQAPDGFDRYWIYMKSIGITKPGEAAKIYTLPGSDPKGQPVFLDSGGTLSRLPTALFNDIIADFPGATEDGTSGMYLVDCALASQDGTVDFGFGNTIISVPYNEFIWHISGSCYVGIAADDVAPVLGDTFLRAAFVVYDQDNQNLLLANAAECGTNLVAIGKGVDAVPSLAGECGASSTSSSSTSSATSSSTSSSSSSSITSSSSSSEKFPSSTKSSSSSSATVTSTSSILYPITNSTSTYTRTRAGPTSTKGGEVTSISSTEYSTSTVYTTSIYTITSCAPTVTHCPVGSVTTEVISLTTTLCPVTPTPTPTEYTTSTVYATSVYTVTSCAAVVTDCPAKIGKVTTEIISLYTTVCPVKPTPKPAYSTSTVYETKTYTISSCAPIITNCPYGSKTTEILSYTTKHPITYTEHSTETFYATKTYTVSKCSAGVPYCPYGMTTTEHLPLSTSVHTYSSVPATAYVPVSEVANPAAIPSSSLVAKPVATSTASGVVTAKPSATVVPFTGTATTMKAVNVALFAAALGLLVVM